MVNHFRARYLFLFLLLWGYSGLFAGTFIIKGHIDDKDRNQVEALLEEIQQIYVPRLDVSDNFRLTLEVCKDVRHFVSLTGASPWSGGHFKRNTIYLQRLELLRQREILRKTLVHEFLHYCIRQKLGKDSTRWLDEGLVLIISGEIKDLDCPPLRFRSQSRSPRQLNRDLRAVNFQKLKEAYCRCGLLVRRLLLNLLKPRI